MIEAPLALSLVIPVHNEEGNVEDLHAHLARVLGTLDRSHEIIFVNDGSRDGTLARLQDLRRRDATVRIVDLDGNFGEAAALSAGFAHARGAVVVTLDGDGQNDPADIPRLLARLEPGIDAVSGRRRQRREPFLSRVLPSRMANALIAMATGVPVHDCGCGLKAYRRELLRGIQLPRGMNRFLPAILGVDPERVAEVWVEDRPRGAGHSHYGLSRTLAVLRDLMALPLLVRRRSHDQIAGRAYRLAVLVSVALLISVLGWPAGRLAVLPAMVAVPVAGVSGAVAYNLRRFSRAQAVGVFRVRKISWPS
jgi:glycosyltransferase involved in cell wall biosynthesis